MRAVVLTASWLVAALAVGAQQPVVDEKARTVTVPATVVKQGRYEQLKGAIEYILVASGGKDYETVFATECAPAAIHQALLRIGLTAGKPAADGQPPQGKPVRILLVYDHGGKSVSRPADECVAYRKTGKPLAPGTWTFTGSTTGFDPAADKQVLQASVTRSLVGLHHTDASPLLQNPRAEATQENLYKANAQALPPAGAAVRLVFQRVMAKVAAGTRRVHVFITGRVQGVGFRAYTQREARRRKLAGWVRNLADGRVEAVVEGPGAQVDALLERLKRGPRAARVANLDAQAEPAEGGLETFDIRY